MKTKVLSLAILLLSMLTMNAQLENLKIYGGVNVAGSSSTDFTNFHISDWENYGLVSVDPSSNEGRVAVNLKEMEAASVSAGIFVGADYSLSKRFSAIGEVQYSLSGISQLGVGLGINFKVISGEKFSLGLTPKIGYNTGSVDLGKISIIGEYTPPVILPEGTFDEGDKLSMKFSGIFSSIGISPEFKITDKVGIRSFIGYNISFSKSDGVECNDVLLPMDARGVVKDDLSSAQAGITPSVSNTGFSLQLGISYSL